MKLLINGLHASGTEDSFAPWLSELFGQPQQDVRDLLKKRTTVEFLIVWALFESRCFAGYVQRNKIAEYADRLVDKEKFDSTALCEVAEAFHQRYQDQRRLSELLNKDESWRGIHDLAALPFTSLSEPQKISLCLFIVYRVRNNIFHGNKPVHDWLRDDPLIRRCIDVLQLMVSHAESIEPRLRLMRQAA